MSHFHHHDGPFYAHLIQTNKYNGAGDWHRWLVTAASREDMKIFFRGLQKYSKTSGAHITDVHPVNLAWWNFSSPDGNNVLVLLQNIYRESPSWYNNVEELTKSSGKIVVSLLNDGLGNTSREWPILPAQNVSLDDY